MIFQSVLFSRFLLLKVLPVRQSPGPILLFFIKPDLYFASPLRAAAAFLHFHSLLQVQKWHRASEAGSAFYPRNHSTVSSGRALVGAVFLGCVSAGPTGTRLAPSPLFRMYFCGNKSVFCSGLDFCSVRKQALRAERPVGQLLEG